ncbi:MAG: ectonucleotide pyrophosphatase/phosphodiesterase [Candidatus Cyclobacteriaceae bacterium M2_1C_046]
MKAYFPLLFFFIIIFGCKEKDELPYVILISFDGFRYDYVEKYETPNFDKFIKDGAAAEKLIPTFPSKTFPNHYSIVTGMYPGSHGLVDNNFYDSITNEVYGLDKRHLVSNPYYYGGKPLWTLAQENGLKTASYFWVGSEAEISGAHPDYFYKYDSKIPDQNRIDQVINWLKLDKESRPHLITLYFSLLDDLGHDYGPGTKEIKEGVTEADRLLGHLMMKLEDIELPVNVIITSDHGMKKMKTSEETYILLDEYLNLQDSAYLIVSSGTHVHIYGENRVIDSLYKSVPPHEKFNKYKKENFAENWHYEHYRSGDLLLTAHAGYYFSTSEKVARVLEKSEGKYWGMHGFDPYTTPEMGAIFYANGPTIKKETKIPAFENIHIYPFIAEILNLEIEHKIDGDKEILKPILE